MFRVASPKSTYTSRFLVINCRWMKAWGVNISSEKKQRVVAKELAVPFAFPLDGGGEELREAPLAYAPSLLVKICDLLRQNDE